MEQTSVTSCTNNILLNNFKQTLVVWIKNKLNESWVTELFSIKNFYICEEHNKIYKLVVVTLSYFIKLIICFVIFRI